MNIDVLLAAAASSTTPLAIVDETVMCANIAAMQALADKARAALRPHAKTHKSAHVARLQLEAGAQGLTVATLREAEYFAQMGAEDLLLVHPPVGVPKISRLASLSERVPRLTVAVDSLEAAMQVPQTVGLLWEVDTGHHRLGTLPGPPTVEAVRRLVDHVGIERFKGLLTFPGHSYQEPDVEGRRAIAYQEIALLQETADLLRKHQIEVYELSIGSTPTAGFAPEVRHMTEMRPGSYVYGDANQVTLESQSLDECALGVVATVVSTPARDRAVIDAGTKALSVDARVPGLSGFGIVLDHPGVILERLSEEHGILVSEMDTGLHIGDRVIVIPVHCCTTINLHEQVLMVSTEGTATWNEVGARGWQPAFRHNRRP
jgi:D-serine deaminase-like pyridoxal phosphate-dependent protein